MRHLYATLAIAVFLAIASARPVAAIPADELLNSLKPTGDVNDFAGLLSQAEKNALEARCRQLREKTGAQLAVVTLQSLRGGEIDDFANKLFARWGIGQKERKNGLLLIVAMEDRKSRIEVGYGLEPIIPDVLAGRILDHELRPHFRKQQYAKGLSAAANSLCDLVERGEPADREALAAPGGEMLVAVIFFLTAFVIVGSLIAGIGFGSRTMPAWLFGLPFAGVSMLIGMAIAWPIAPSVQLPISLVTGALGYYFARHGTDHRRRGRRRRQPSSSSWDWADFSRASSGSWTSTGSGGFSQSWGGFGGGSSGGGGASSSW